MCRLVGIKNFDSTIHRDIVRDFFSLAKKGAVPPGNEPGHLDGWGVGWYAGGKAVIQKSGGSAIDEAHTISDIINGIGTSRILIAHLRKSAWNDTANSRHAHPFGYTNYLFAHNGTVIDYHPLQQALPQAFAPEKDSLDTEVLFRAILSAPGKNMAAQCAATVSTVKKLNYTALNMLLTDGNELLGYRDYSKYPDYYTLYTATIGTADIICSEPLPMAGAWSALSNGQLIVV